MAEQNELFADVKIDIDIDMLQKKLDTLNISLEKTNMNMESFRKKKIVPEGAEQSLTSMKQAAVDAGNAVADALTPHIKSSVEKEAIDGITSSLNKLADSSVSASVQIANMRRIVREMAFIFSKELKTDGIDDTLQKLSNEFGKTGMKHFADLAQGYLNTVEVLRNTKKELEKAHKEIEETANK